jgi:hypothetical protein
MNTIAFEAVRLDTVIRAHDEAQRALLLAANAEAEPDVATALIEAALGSLATAGGQLNWHRQEAAEASAEYWASISPLPMPAPATDAELLSRAQAAAAIRRSLNAQRQARSGEQKNDRTVPSREAVSVLREHVFHRTPEGREVVAVRVKSEGFGRMADDMRCLDIERLLPSERVGATVLYAADAPCAGFVGSVTGGQLQEICYELAGNRWYLYLLNSNGGDTWQQEWWVSSRRLDAGVAADAIEAARAISSRI